MSNTIILRKFEERDVDFIYKCKNDENLNSMIVGSSRAFSYEDAVKWVRGCMQDNPSFIFWAVCTNDQEKRIIGWVSLSQIDQDNHSACHHGIVIGSKEYRDGTAMFEAMLLSMEYAFDTLMLHRLYGTCLSEHKVSPHMLNALGFKLEGTQKEAVYRNSRYYDVLEYAMLDNEYKDLKSRNVFDVNNLIMSFVSSVKEKNRQKKSFNSIIKYGNK